MTVAAEEIESQLREIAALTLVYPYVRFSTDWRTFIAHFKTPTAGSRRDVEKQANPVELRTGRRPAPARRTRSW